MKLTRLATLAAMVMISAASLTACDPGGPIEPTPSASASAATPTATATATPTPDPSTVAAFIVVNGSGVGVGAINSASIVQIPYTTDGATAAALLSDAIGVTPVVADTLGSGSGCSSDYRTYDWGGLQFRSPGEITTPGGQMFNAIVTAPATTGGLELATANFQHVGMPTADFATGVAGTIREDFPGHAFVYFDRQNPDAYEYDAWGAFASSEGGAISRIIAPLYFYGDC
ncbi:MAG: hypothetical protein Q8M65_06755 [Rhodoglobus sp.]|nr:hypothetical protein [Rhodoglobus sp.]